MRMFILESARELREQGVEIDKDGREEELFQWELERNSWVLLRELFMYVGCA